MKTKHVKPRQEGESGQILKVEAPIHHSQVQLVTADGKARAPTLPSACFAFSLTSLLSQVSRVGKKVGEDGKKFRVFASTGERVPEPARPPKASA